MWRYYVTLRGCKCKYFVEIRDNDDDDDDDDDDGDGGGGGDDDDADTLISFARGTSNSLGDVCNLAPISSGFFSDVTSFVRVVVLSKKEMRLLELLMYLQIVIMFGRDALGNFHLSSATTLLI
jgi:hypothetical protein